MTATIITKNKTTSGTPSSLAQGELAVNIADKKLFVGGSGGSSVVDLGFNGGTITDVLTVEDVKTSDTAPLLKLKLDATSSNYGDMLNFTENTTDWGKIGLRNEIVTKTLYIVKDTVGLKFYQYSTSNNVSPCTGLGANRDAAIDLGSYASRFKNVYRSGSTYSSSDRNKKQDIRDLTEAEARVATVAKNSLKAFRYIDRVQEKGDDANIHFGIIAQDLKAAFEAEGLSADSYQVLKTITYTDDEGVEQTTYNVCYENLLAFIIAAI
jgi:hypothetical protein